MPDATAFERVRNILKPVVFRTPLAGSPNLGRLVGANIFLKLENLQRTGAFKIRGAYHRLWQLAQERPQARVVAASAGNHAQGVALAGKLLGFRVTIFMPVNVSLSKREATAGYGAEVRLAGATVEECLEEAKSWDPDAVFVHPFDDPDIILGQGSLGLEILDDMEDVDAVVVPIGGGGLLAGVAAAVKTRSPRVRVIGVEPCRAPSAHAALEAGLPVDVVTRPTLADGTRVGRIGEHTLPIIRNYVDEVVQVEEQHIAQAMLLLLERRRVVAEGAGALGLAAFLAGKAPGLDGKNVVLVVSGGNVDANLIGRIIDQGLIRSGRIFRFYVIMDDMPGALAGLLADVASTRANVLHIHHDRLGKNLPTSSTRVGLELETRGFGHAAEISDRLKSKGYEIIEE